MAIQFKKITTSDKGNRIILFRKEEDLKGWKFSSDESKFIKSQIAAGKKSITLNHLHSFSYLIMVEDKKTQELTLEACRISGHSLASAINGQKMTQIDVVDSGKLGRECLALAEGLALSCYQFLKYKTAKDKAVNTLSKIQLASETVSKRDLELLEISVSSVLPKRQVLKLKSLTRQKLKA
jgi:leucyl aminopeptidase